MARVAPATELAASVPVQQWYEVLDDFSAQDENELSVRAGEVVVSRGGGEDGWILVSRRRESGYVPTAYIRAASPSVASSSGAAPAPPAAAAPPVAPPPRRNPNVVRDVDDSDDDDDDEGTVGPRLEKARARAAARKKAAAAARLHGIARMAEMLEATESVKIEQQIHVLEAASGGCCEQENRYRIYGGQGWERGEAALFVAEEQSGDCDRVCCKPHNNLLLHINARDTDETLITLERKGMKCCCDGPRQCLFCPVLGESCAEEMIVHEGGVQGEPGNINPATKLSLIRQPVPLGGCFTPTLEVLDASGALDAKATGPCCFGGWSEICCDSTFVLKRGDAPLATITHLAPRNFCDDETCAAICTDSDKFQVKFDATASATDKANAVAAGLLVDYMFFEIDHGLCGVENNCTGGKNIHCTLFLCYVAGCLLPCNISIPLDEPAGPCAEGGAAAGGECIPCIPFGRPPQPETSVGAPAAPDARPRAAPRAQLLPAMRAHKMEHRD